jgi:hypothetical protein
MAFLAATGRIVRACSTETIMAACSTFEWPEAVLTPRVLFHKAHVMYDADATVLGLLGMAAGVRCAKK